MENTLVLIKPDGVERGLTGRIIERFENAGFKIIAMKMVWIDEEHASKHYDDLAERRGQQVFDNNKEFMTSGPVVAMVLSGISAIEVVRKIVGGTEPKTSLPGTIRGDFAHQSYEATDKAGKSIHNLIHASSDEKDAKREIELWFDKTEMHDYKTVHEKHTL